MSESELIARLKEGDQESFAALVTGHGAYMLSVANRIVRNEADAQDCLQEAFMKVFSSITQFEGRSGLRTWLHRIVANAALMRLRSEKRKQEDSLDHLLPTFDKHGTREPQTYADQHAELSVLMQKTQVQDIVRQAIDRLPEQYRAVLIARDIEGFSTEESTRILDINVNAVKTRLHRARAALKTLLQPAISAGAV